MSTRRLPIFLLTLLLVAGCSGDDSPTDPGPPAGGTTLEVVIPDPITSGRPFQLEVTALDASGTGPDPDFNGTIALSVSSGTVTPASVSVSGGVGSASVTVVSTAPSVELSFSHPSANSKIDVKCAQPGAVEVTSGRMFLLAGASARTFSGNEFRDDKHDVAMPGEMSFSGSASAEVESRHLIPNSESEFWIAKSSANGDMTVTSNLSGGSNLRSLNVIVNSSTTASFNGDVGQGAASGTVSSFVEIAFTVQDVAVIAEVVGEFDGSSFNLRDSDGQNLIWTFGDHSAVIGPGDYTYRVQVQDTEAAADRTEDVTTSLFLDATLSFTEVPPEE
jgi:hypothetical protein